MCRRDSPRTTWSSKHASAGCGQLPISRRADILLASSLADSIHAKLVGSASCPIRPVGGPFMASTTPAKSGASTDRHDALSEVLAESWWAVGLRGILAIAFGLICLVVPTAAILALILLFSAYMLAVSYTHLRAHETVLD